MNATFRPLPVWPYEPTRSRRHRPFKASWSTTLYDLDREVSHLRGSAVIIAAGFAERDIRLDGMPRGDARAPSHPGVEISFDTRKLGRLIYRTDVCDFWQDNVRSIALGLEALRAVDRYGISPEGQQYAGWKALPAGEGRGVIIAGMPEAREILLVAADAEDFAEWDLEDLWRRAVKRTHPDQGGTDVAFMRVQAAYALLKGQDR